MKDGLINIAKKFLLAEAAVKEYTLNDASTLSDFESETEIIAHLVKDPKIKAATGGSKNLYFDGSELVYKDKTVKGGLIDKDGFSAKVKLGDLKKAILSMPGLHEAATDMLLNRPESVINEGVPSINWENLTTKELFDIVTKAGLELSDKIPSHHFPTKGYWKHFNDAREDLMRQFKKIGLYKEASDEG